MMKKRILLIAAVIVLIALALGGWRIALGARLAPHEVFLTGISEQDGQTFIDVTPNNSAMRICRYRCELDSNGTLHLKLYSSIFRDPVAVVVDAPLAQIERISIERGGISHTWTSAALQKAE